MATSASHSISTHTHLAMPPHCGTQTWPMLACSSALTPIPDPTSLAHLITDVSSITSKVISIYSPLSVSHPQLTQTSATCTTQPANTSKPGSQLTCGAWVQPAMRSASPAAVRAFPVRGWRIALRERSQQIAEVLLLFALYFQQIPSPPPAFGVKTKKKHLPSLSDARELPLKTSCSCTLQAVLLLICTGVEKVSFVFSTVGPHQPVPPVPLRLSLAQLQPEQLLTLFPHWLLQLGQCCC